jgi:diguanylate cyclase (GGDEF)-like protein
MIPNSLQEVQVPELAKHHILVIDDDPVIRRILTKSLVDAGYHVTSAATGTEGLALARTKNPNLILVDVMMPEMDGYQVCNHLRQDPQTMNMPIIMLTALDETESVVKGLRTGADDYMIKPFEIEELLARVEIHLRRSERDINVNPLTNLPGNPQIERVIIDRIAQRAPMAVMYIDLTNFKPYNDEYGWLKGDLVIKMLAQHIITVVREWGSKSDFVGHIGGDDFIVVSVPERAEKIGAEITSRFDASIRRFYREEDRARGYIQTLDRQGKPFRAPLVTVSIAIVTNKYRPFEHLGQVAAMAADVKKYVKSLPGSHYAFDRRRK